MIFRTKTQLTKAIRLQLNSNRFQFKKAVTNINNRQIHFANEYKFYYVKNQSKKIFFLDIDHRKMKFRNFKKIKTDYRSIHSRRSLFYMHQMSIVTQKSFIEKYIFIDKNDFTHFNFFKFIFSEIFIKINASFVIKFHLLTSIKNFYIEFTVKSRKSLSNFFKFIKILMNFEFTFNFIAKKIVKNLNALSYKNSSMIMIIVNDSKYFLFEYIRVKVITAKIFKMIQT